MRSYHRPTDEKRLASSSTNDWLNAQLEQSMAFIRQNPADRFQAGSVDP
jgi:hypothetical protein